MTLDAQVVFDPQVELPAAEGRLATMVARLPRKRIQAIEYEGARLWVKRALPEPRTGFQAWMRAVLVQRPWLGMRWLPRVEWGSEPLLREARRLVHLRGAGVAVPEVICASSHWMVLAHTGESMHVVLKSLGERNSAWLLSRAAADLAAFHLAGYWHGGAQVKNTTIMNGQRARIDFDDGFDASLSLADLQARDLFFFLVSCVDWADARTRVSLVDAYLAQGGEGLTVEQAAGEMSRVCGWWSLKLVPGRDVRRVLGAAVTLRDAADRSIG